MVVAAGWANGNMCGCLVAYPVLAPDSWVILRIRARGRIGIDYISGDSLKCRARRDGNVGG